MSEIDCEEVLEQIERYVDGELDSHRSLQLAEHLKVCAFCLDHADFRRRLKEIVRTKCREERTPEYLVTRIRRSIRHEPPRP